ncbi:MAG: cytochrome b5 domain-containing protein [Candidatus Paceibacteria bacterium]
MKLKYITLASFVVFVGTILVLGVLSVDGGFSSLGNENTNADISTVGTIPSVVPIAGTGVVLNLEEIAKHNTRNDCYLIIKDSVYSVAGFIDQHPGGANKILEMCGKEATKTFTLIHSNFAWNLLKDFYIGKVGQEVSQAQAQSAPLPTTNLGKQKGSEDEDEDEYEVEYEKD